MKLTDARADSVWLPLTPPKVAAMAFARWHRVLAVQLLFAALTGLAVAAWLGTACFPVVRGAIEMLPDRGEIRAGALDWGGPDPAVLASNPWLALNVDLHGGGLHRFPSDVQVEFRETDMRVVSLVGYVDLPYPRGYRIAFNRPVLDPWWRAREPFLVAGGALVTMVGLPLLWSLLGLAYAGPASLAGRFVSAGLPLRAAWKLCCASQMPGALACAVAVLLYAVRAIDLVPFLFIAAAHVVAGWIYLFLSLFFLPARAPSRGGRVANPFQRQS